MLPHFNLAELAILLIIIVVLFGVGRVGKIGGELGTAIREFRKGLNGEDQKPPITTTEPTPVPPSVPSTTETPTNKVS